MSTNHSLFYSVPKNDDYRCSWPRGRNNAWICTISSWIDRRTKAERKERNEEEWKTKKVFFFCFVRFAPQTVAGCERRRYDWTEGLLPIFLGCFYFYSALCCILERNTGTDRPTDRRRQDRFADLNTAKPTNQRRWVISTTERSALCRCKQNPWADKPYRRMDEEEKYTVYIYVIFRNRWWGEDFWPEGEHRRRPRSLPRSTTKNEGLLHYHHNHLDRRPRRHWREGSSGLFKRRRNESCILIEADYSPFLERKRGQDHLGRCWRSRARLWFLIR